MSQNPRGRTRSYLPATRTFRLGETADIASQSPGQAGRQPRSGRVAVAADFRKVQVGPVLHAFGAALSVPQNSHLRSFTSSRRRATFSKRRSAAPRISSSREDRPLRSASDRSPRSRATARWRAPQLAGVGGHRRRSDEMPELRSAFDFGEMPPTKAERLREYVQRMRFPVARSCSSRI